jgi:hypothetical protein
MLSASQFCVALGEIKSNVAYLRDCQYSRIALLLPTIQTLRHDCGPYSLNATSLVYLETLADSGFGTANSVQCIDGR